MNVQKLQVRADLERMVYNYALLGKIDNITADKIVSFIDLTIGGGDMAEPRGKIIAFPIPEAKQKNAGEDSTPKKPDFTDWRKNFDDSGFEDYKFVGAKILWALYDLRINSLEELANTPPSKIMRCRNVGKKAIAIIKAVLEKNGLVTGGGWEAAL